MKDTINLKTGKSKKISKVMKNLKKILKDNYWSKTAKSLEYTKVSHI